MFDLATSIGLAIMVKSKPFLIPGGLLGVAYISYRTMPKTRVKTKMLKCFRMGELYIKKKTLGKDSQAFPIIRTIQFKNNYTTIVFSIPFGLDPKEVEKHDWLFRQQFGSRIGLEQAGKRFTLTIYEKELKQFNYKYSDIELTQKLPILVGKSYQGYQVYDMAEYPHLLIAGETGSGKSTQLRSILTTLIKYKDPKELELYLGDLKRSEFHMFRRVQHVKEVMTRTKELYRVLVRIKKELEDRGDLLDTWELTHIDDYNKVAEKKKPYIVLCIDEVALLKKEKDIMAIIEDISAIGRALGVFLILSMQRPDAEVLDGKLKNNLTVRMAFRHSNDINSRITIESGEAAQIKLNERGRMYFKHETLKEVQAPFLSAEKAKKILEPYKTRREDFKDMGEAQEAPEKKETILGVLDDAS